MKYFEASFAIGPRLHNTVRKIESKIRWKTAFSGAALAALGRFLRLC